MQGRKVRRRVRCKAYEARNLANSLKTHVGSCLRHACYTKSAAFIWIFSYHICGNSKKNLFIFTKFIVSKEIHNFQKKCDRSDYNIGKSREKFILRKRLRSE